MVPHRSLIDHFPGNGEFSSCPGESDDSEFRTALNNNLALLAVLAHGRCSDIEGSVPCAQLGKPFALAPITTQPARCTVSARLSAYSDELAGHVVAVMGMESG